MLDDSTPEIDFDHLNQFVGGDIALTAEIFGMFQNQVEMWGRGLNIDADDETWSAITHSLKGSAKAVGATKMADICQKAEQLVGESNRPGAREVALQNIEHKIYQVSAEIQRWQYRRKIKGI